MKLLFIILVSFMFKSCNSQGNNSSICINYEINNFHIIDSSSVEDGDRFLKIFQCKLDHSLFMKEIYLDSARTLLNIRAFMKGKVYDGPVFYYNSSLTNINGKLVTKGYFKNGLKDGEWINYNARSGKKERIYYYRMDKRISDWLYLDSNGNIIKKESYN